MPENDLSGEIIVRILGLEGGGAPASPGGVGTPSSTSGMRGGFGGGSVSTNPFFVEEKKQTDLLSGVMAGPLKWLAGIFGVGALVSQSKILNTTLSTFMQMVSALIDTLLMPFVPLIAPVLEAVGKQVAETTKAMNAIMQSVRDVGWGETFKLIAIGAWAEIKDFAVTFWTGLTATAKETLGGIIAFFKDLPGDIWNLFRDFLGLGEKGKSSSGDIQTNRSVVSEQSLAETFVNALKRYSSAGPGTSVGLAAGSVLVEIYQRGQDIESLRITERNAAEKSGQIFGPPWISR